MELHAQPENPNGTDAQASEKNTRKFGCSGCLMVFFGIILFFYILIFQTSIPLKLIAGSIEKNTVIDGRHMEISGVGGSLSRGVKIRTLVIPGEYGDTTITGLKFRYKKPIRMFTRGQVTLTEISTDSADFIVAEDFFDSDDEGGDAPTEEWEEEHDESNEESLVTGEGFFDLHLLEFKNTRFRTVDGSVDISIPLIQMKGLHIDSDDFRIESFNIDSDVLDVSLTEGRSVEIEGETIAFDQRIDIAIKPGIHESVIKTIPVSFEFSKSKGRSASRITAFDGALEQVDFEDESSLVRINSLSPLDYLTFEDQVIPSELNLSAREKEDLVDLKAGSFVIGKTLFRYEGRQLQADEEEVITGVTTVGPYEITAHLRPKKEDNAWPPLQVELDSKPEAAKQEILAQLHHGKPYASLTDEEKTAIDKLK